MKLGECWNSVELTSPITSLNRISRMVSLVIPGFFKCLPNGTSVDIWWIPAGVILMLLHHFSWWTHFRQSVESVRISSETGITPPFLACHLNENASNSPWKAICYDNGPIPGSSYCQWPSTCRGFLMFPKIGLPRKSSRRSSWVFHGFPL